MTRTVFPRRLRQTISVVLIAPLCLVFVHTVASAAEKVPVSVTRHLNLAAAAYGPAALIKTLKEELHKHPSLAHTPGSAAALARAAARPVASFRGANLPVYRDIIRTITNEAPAREKSAVRKAVQEAVLAVARKDKKGTTVMLRHAAAGQQHGIRVGSFLVSPEMHAAEFYDDNIFATQTNKKSAFVTVVAPHVFVKSLWSRNKVTAEAHADVTEYARYTDQSTVDYRVSTEDRYDFKDNRTHLFGGLFGMRKHEDVDSPDATGALEPTIYYEARGYAGLSHKFSNIVTKVGATLAHLVFDNTETAGGTVDNGDRNRNHMTYGISAAYDTGGAFTPYVQLTGDSRLYVNPIDNNGYRRSSHGGDVMIGSDFALLKKKLTGGLGIGYMAQSYQDTRFSTTQALALKGNLLWRPVTETRLSLYTERSIDETTLLGSSGVLYTTAGGFVEHKLTRSLSFILRGVYSHSDFRGISRVDDDYEESVGLSYALSPRTSIATDYRNQKRFSNTNGASFNRNQIFVRLSVSY